MTANDYRELAEMIRRLQPKSLVNTVALQMAESLKNRNIRFDKAKFLLAAGYMADEDDES